MQDTARATALPRSLQFSDDSDDAREEEEEQKK